MIIRFNNRIIKCIFVVVTILLSGHALQTILPWITWLPVVLGAACTVMLVGTLKNKILYGDTWLFLALILMIGATVITQFLGGLSTYIRFSAVVVIAYFIVQTYSFDEVVRCYRAVMTFTTIVALVGYALVQSTDVLEALPTYENVNGVEYGIGYVFNYIRGVSDRNCGMFWEPGLLATHLTFATVIELLFVEKTDWKRIILYSVTYFTANSSAGFVLWFLCMLLVIVRRSGNKKTSPIASAFRVVSVIAAIILIYNFDIVLMETGLGDNEYFIKLSTDRVSNSSRAFAIAHNLRLFAAHPIFGAGFSETALQMEHVADTSTSTYLMSVFGVLGTIYTIAWVWGIISLKKENMLSKIVLIALILIIINKEPHHNLLFTWCLLFYCARNLRVKFWQIGNMQKYDDI